MINNSDLEIDIQSVSDFVKKASITVLADTVNSCINKRFAEVSSTASVKGFRKGKVPDNVIKQKYGDEVITEAISNIIKESVSLYVKDYNLQLAATPIIDTEKYEQGENLNFSVTVEIFPDIEVDLSSIQLTRYVIEIDDATKEKIIQKFMHSNRKLLPISESRSVQKKDIVNIDFTGYIDDKPFDNGAAKGFDLEIGSKSFIDNFEDQLIGKNINDDVNVVVQFPSDYDNEELAGKKADFKVRINAINYYAEPESKEELAKKLNCKDYAELENRLLASTNIEYEKMSNVRLSNDLFDKIKSIINIDMPQSLIDKEIEIMREEKQYADKDKKDLLSEAKKRAGLSIFYSNFSKEKDIKITEADMNQFFVEYAMRYPGQEKAILAEVYKSKNKDIQEYARNSIYKDKIFEEMLACVKITDRNIKLKDFLAEVKK